MTVKKKEPLQEAIVKETAKSRTASNPFALEGIPGFGPAIIKSIKDEGIMTTLQLARKDPVWLKDVTGMDKDKAGVAFQFILNKLRDAGLMTPLMQTATKLLEQREKIKRIKSNCHVIDHLFNGGLECVSMTELYGEEGAGKTQLSHNFAIQVQRPVLEGGLAVEGKMPPMVAYLDTENTFRPERIISMLRGKKLISDYPAELKRKIIEGKALTVEEIKEKEACEAKFTKEAQEKYLDNILHLRIMDAHSLVRQLNEVANWVSINPDTITKENPQGERYLPIELIVIDSATYPFRYHYVGLGTQKTEKDLLKETVHMLTKISEVNKVAVLLINQIWTVIGEDAKYMADTDMAYGGHIWGHAVPYRFKIEKSGTKRRIKIIKSPYQANDDVRFDIAEQGPIDIEG